MLALFFAEKQKVPNSTCDCMKTLRKRKLELEIIHLEKANYKTDLEILILQQQLGISQSACADYNGRTRIISRKS